MQAKSFNAQISLEVLCYSVFGGLMFYLVRSGKYLFYVTPRMEPYLYFTAIVMGIWALVGLGRIFRPQHRLHSMHCLVLAIPILLLVLPHNPLSTSDISSNYIGGSNFFGQNTYNLPQKQTPSDSSGSSATTNIPTDTPAGNITAPAEDPSVTVPPEEEYSPDLPGLDVANHKITVANDDFGMWLTELYTNMGQYNGYTIRMTGFVFQDPNIIKLKEDEFILARLMMSCCVADVSPVGLICKYDKASTLKTKSWVTVEGTLFIGQYEYKGVKYDDPQISVTKITSAEAVKGYVYP